MMVIIEPNDKWWETTDSLRSAILVQKSGIVTPNHLSVMSENSLFQYDFSDKEQTNSIFLLYLSMFFLLEQMTSLLLCVSEFEVVMLFTANYIHIHFKVHFYGYSKENLTKTRVRL